VNWRTGWYPRAVKTAPLLLVLLLPGALPGLAAALEVTVRDARGAAVEDAVVFDTPGEGMLGCNIHDPMIAYVCVVDTPWFAKTGTDGQLRIEGMPGGDYEPHLVKLKGDETPLKAIAARPLPK
jgi:hypothetical protein